MFSRTLIPALAALLATQSAFAATCSRSYTVKAGDICDTISANNQVSTYQLAAINPSIDAGCDNLLPGETLCLGTDGADCSDTYLVTADDICETVAAKNNINTTILMVNNPNINDGCTNIYPGEVLCVADFLVVPPPPTGSTPSTSASATPTPPPTANTEDDLPDCEDDDDDGL